MMTFFRAVIFLTLKERHTMRNENGYGSIIRLPGKRRKPYAVRVTVGYVQDLDGKVRQKQKYLAYFGKRSDAVAWLADYNRGDAEAEDKHNVPTLKQVYSEWYNWKWNRQNRPGRQEHAGNPRPHRRVRSCT